MSYYPYNYCQQFEKSPSSSTNCGFGRSYTKLSMKNSANTIYDTPTVSAKSSIKLKKKSSKVTKKAANSSHRGVVNGRRSNDRDIKSDINSSKIDQMTRVNSNEYITTLNGSNIRLHNYESVENMKSNNDYGANTTYGSYPIKYNTKNNSPLVHKNNTSPDQNKAFRNHATRSKSNFLEHEQANGYSHMLQRNPSYESQDFHYKQPNKTQKTDFQNSNTSSYRCLIPDQDSKGSLTKSNSFIRNVKCVPKLSNKCSCCNCSSKHSKSNNPPGQTYKIQQPKQVFKNNTISTKNNPQLDVINEEPEADDISIYNYPQNPQPLKNPTNNSGRFENFKESMLNSNNNATHKTFEDSCADFLNILCDSILESVEKSLDNKLQNYCNKTMEKIESLNKKLDNEEHKMEKLHCDLMEKMSIQNEKYQQQFSLLLKFLVENQNVKEARNTTYKDNESQCNILENIQNKKTDALRESTNENYALPAVSCETKSVLTNDLQISRCCDCQSKIDLTTVLTYNSYSAAQVKTITSNSNNIAAGNKSPLNSNTGSDTYISPSYSHNSSKDLECHCSNNDECDKEKYSSSYLTTFTTGPFQKYSASNISTEKATVIICHKCHNTTRTCICQSDELEERNDIYTDDENWETSGYATDPEDNGENIECCDRKKTKKKSNRKQKTTAFSATPMVDKSNGNIGSGIKNQNRIIKRTTRSRSPTRLSRL